MKNTAKIHRENTVSFGLRGDKLAQQVLEELKESVKNE